MISRKDLNNVIWLVGSGGISRILTFLFTIVLARELGVARFGKYSTAISLVLMFSVVAEIGLFTFVFREVSKNTSLASRYVVNGLAIEAVLAVIVGVAAFFLAWTLGYPDDTRCTIAILWIWVVGVTMGRLIRGVFKANQHMEIEALVEVLEKSVKFILVYIVLHLGYGLIGTAVMIMSSSILTLLVSGIIAQTRFMDFKTRLDIASIKRIIGNALPFAMSVILNTSLYRLDTVVLSVLKGEQQVGLYSAAFRITFTLFFLPALICQAFFPKLSKYATLDNKENFSRLSSTLFEYMFLLIYPVLMIIYIMAPWIIGLLYTSEYATATAVLRILVWTNILNAWSYVSVNTLNAADQERYVMKVLGLSLLVNLLLNFILIPILSYFGAAINTIISEIVVVSFSIHHLKSRMDVRETFSISWLARIVGILVCSFSVIAITEWLRWPLIAALGAFVVGYVVLLWLFGFAAMKDWNRLKKLLANERFSVVDVE